MIDAEAVLAAARRPLVIGIGGGGDVAGALATAEACRLYHGAEPVLGGVAWERRVYDPVPGPRRAAEIEGAVEEIAPGALLAGPDTRIRASGVRFAESHMAKFLGEPVLLADVLGGPAVVASGLAAAARRLETDLIVFLDVGGDVLAHGGEPGLASPLCDAVMIAAAELLRHDGAVPVIGAVFGIGCDGELTAQEVLERIAEVAAAGGLAGVRGLTGPVASRVEAAVELVPTEASALALRAFRGESGTAEIRRGLRTVELTPVAALTVFFDIEAALGSAARLGRAVTGARSLEHANDLLHDLGVRSELDLERDAWQAGVA